MAENKDTKTSELVLLALKSQIITTVAKSLAISFIINALALTILVASAAICLATADTEIRSFAQLSCAIATIVSIACPLFRIILNLTLRLFL
jgi:hypothetical protein